jgi:hypothetical protein
LGKIIHLHISSFAHQTTIIFAVMNEPLHPHFVLSDGQYCHVLEDRLYIGKRQLPSSLPPPNNRLDYFLLALQVLGVCVLGFFTVMTVITSYYVVTFTLGALLILLGLSLIRSTGFTATPVIMREDVVGVDFKKRSFGYDVFIVNYSGPEGKLWKRRLIIYDSAACVKQAVDVMQEAGLLKQG